MKTLKRIYARYSSAILHALQPLGFFGVFALAFVDSAALGMPLDPVVGLYVYAARSSLAKIALYIVMASLGSALGSTVIYWIGKKGGEALLHSRMSRERAERMRRRFERHEFLALMLPSMLPPPTPFKLFLISAAVFQMRYRNFLLAIFAGRVLRFSILALLVVRFGPEAISILGTLLENHLGLSLVVFVAGILAIYWFLRARRRRRGRNERPG